MNCWVLGVVTTRPPRLTQMITIVTAVISALSAILGSVTAQWILHRTTWHREYRTHQINALHAFADEWTKIYRSHNWAICQNLPVGDPYDVYDPNILANLNTHLLKLILVIPKEGAEIANQAYKALQSHLTDDKPVARSDSLGPLLDWGLKNLKPPEA